MNLRYLVCLVLRMLIIVGVIGVSTGLEVRAEVQGDDLIKKDMTTLSLEELMDIDVTTVSKKKQKLSTAAAAIFVITQEDIRRSGVTSIPEALRMVPGMQVARLDGNKWAISARGFNSRFANKLLVLMDGRNVYNPFFAGTLWETFDTILEDIERIEIIRGPGGTLWGVNAVNGVINVITKKAHDTQGWLITGLAGTEEAIGGMRYGGHTSQGVRYRLFTKYLNRDTQFHPTGAHDDSQMIRGGFRADWDADSNNEVMVDGVVYEHDGGQQVTVPTATAPFSNVVDDDLQISGGHILVRWNHEFSHDSDMALQFYFDHFDSTQAALQGQIDTWEVNAQHRFPLPYHQEVVWGGEYRYWVDALKGSFTFMPFPGSMSFNRISLFVQDEITLLPDQLQVILGTKLSHNDFTGLELQPSGRILWKPVPHHTLWATVSRAVKVPSRVADNSMVTQPPAPPALTVPLVILGDQQFKSEVLHAFELGYRAIVSPRVTLDVAAFYNLYHDVQGTRRIPTPPGGTFPTFKFANNVDGEVYGIEVTGNVQVLDWWRLSGHYSHLEMDLQQETGALGLPSTIDGASPRHQASLRSIMNLPHNIEFDTWLRFVDELPSMSIPSYLQMDVRLGWQPWEGVDVSVMGQNLLDRHQPEMTPSFLITQATEIQRSVYGKVTWSFGQ